MTTAIPTLFEARLLGQLEQTVAGSCAERCDLQDHLWTELTHAERQPLQKAVAKRRREFAAGRVAAKRCAQRLGKPMASLPVGSQREPCWPQDLLGSISHDNVSALAWLAPSSQVAGLGLDVEQTSRLKSDTWRMLFTDQELRLLENSNDKELALILFSAKESIYKCLFPTVKRFIGYKEVSIEPQSGDLLVAAMNPELTQEAGLSELLVHSQRSEQRIATWTWQPR